MIGVTDTKMIILQGRKKKQQQITKYATTGSEFNGRIEVKRLCKWYQVVYELDDALQTFTANSLPLH